ncbi:MAG TPA: methyltransferase domain-containing protein [Gemmatimonadaceae bacterium]
MSALNAVAAVEESLRRRFRVTTSDIKVGDRVLSILHPESAEDLIDERDFELDERLPYWAELWPSSRILAERVNEMRGGGRSLIELGCGSGLVATCAALVGFDVTVSDYYEDAVRFARVNAVRNGAPPPKGLVLDWRHLPPDLPRFDVVIASDVLYERAYGPLVAGAIGRALSPSGTAFLADPGRVGRDEFIRSLDGVGLTVSNRATFPFEEGPIRQTITVFEIQRKADPSLRS